MNSLMSDNSVQATDEHSERDINHAVADYDSGMKIGYKISCWSTVDGTLQQKSPFYAIDRQTYSSLIVNSSDRRCAQLISQTSNKATARAHVLQC